MRRRVCTDFLSALLAASFDEAFAESVERGHDMVEVQRFTLNTIHISFFDTDVERP